MGEDEPHLDYLIEDRVDYLVEDRVDYLVEERDEADDQTSEGWNQHDYGSNIGYPRSPDEHADFDSYVYRVYNQKEKPKRDIQSAELLTERFFSDVSFGRIQFVQEGLHRGIDPNVRCPESLKCNFVGWTALILASNLGETAIVRLLLKAGANVHLKSPSGQTALGEAERFNHVTIQELLKSAGAVATSQVTAQSTNHNRTATALRREPTHEQNEGCLLKYLVVVLLIGHVGTLYLAGGNLLTLITQLFRACWS